VGEFIVLGINAVSAKYVPQALRDAGYQPVFIVDPDSFAGEAAASMSGCTCYPADIEDPDQVRKLFAEVPAVTERAVAISSLFDEKVPLVRELADRYGLKGPDPVFARLASKAEVDRLIPEWCPPTSAFPAAGWWRAELGPAPEGYVLKPAEQAGARGVQKLPAGATPEMIRDAIAASGLPLDDDQVWLLQPVTAGRLVSLEGYADGGQARFLGFSLRGRVGWTEVSNLYPADDMISPPARARCRDAVRALIRRSGMTRGYFHSEFLVDGDDAVLIDANMGRVGGACIVEQLALVHGVTPAEILRHVLTLGVPDLPPSPAPAYRPPPQPISTTGYFYGLAGGGVIESVTVPPGGRCLHTQIAPGGHRVGAVGTGDDAWVGTLAGLTRDAVTEIAAIEITTADGHRHAAAA
jgi:hypothetical protein